MSHWDGGHREWALKMWVGATPQNFICEGHLLPHLPHPHLHLLSCICFSPYTGVIPLSVGRQPSCSPSPSRLPPYIPLKGLSGPQSAPFSRKTLKTQRWASHNIFCPCDLASAPLIVPIVDLWPKLSWPVSPANLNLRKERHDDRSHWSCSRSESVPIPLIAASNGIIITAKSLLNEPGLDSVGLHQKNSEANWTIFSMFLFQIPWRENLTQPRLWNGFFWVNVYPKANELWPRKAGPLRNMAIVAHPWMYCSGLKTPFQAGWEGPQKGSPTMRSGREGEARHRWG